MVRCSMACAQWQQLSWMACDVAVIGCPSADWTKGAKSAEESVSRAVAWICFVTSRGLAVEAVVSVDGGCGSARTLK